MIKVNRAIKVRIYPTPEQMVLLAKTFGCCRFMWNKMLGDEIDFYHATNKCFVPTPAKYKNQFSFLKEVDSLALANVQLNLKSAFSMFFDPMLKAEHPTFKKKKLGQCSYTTNNQNGTVALDGNYIRLPKLGLVKGTIHRRPKKSWVLKSATISQSSSGKCFCSLLYEFLAIEPKPIIPTTKTTLGLDYSSPCFYVDSNGEGAQFPRFYRQSEKRLAVMQRNLTRMKKDSRNYKECSLKVSLLHEKIANQRKDFCHQLSRKIANSYDAVCVEDINLRGMAGSLKLGKSTNDNGFGMFRNMLAYKLQAQGKAYIVIDKWYPSTKTCHDCGYVNPSLTLKDREWTCPNCGAHLSRDYNAALNIRDAGLLQYATD